MKTLLLTLGLVVALAAVAPLKERPTSVAPLEERPASVAPLKERPASDTVTITLVRWPFT